MWRRRRVIGASREHGLHSCDYLLLLLFLEDFTVSYHTTTFTSWATRTGYYLLCMRNDIFSLSSFFSSRSNILSFSF